MNKLGDELVKNFKSGMCVMPVKYSLARRDKIDWVITLLKPSNRGEVEKFPYWSSFNVKVLTVERDKWQIQARLRFWHCHNNDKSLSWACPGTKTER